MSVEHWLRLVLGVSIVLAYACNVMTGWRATSMQLEAVGRRWRYAPWAAMLLLRFSLRPTATDWPGSCPACRRETLRLLLYAAPWFSTLAAFMMAAAHLEWLLAGAWRYQEHLGTFAVAHLLAATVLHIIHTLIFFVRYSREGGVKCELMKL